MNGLVKRRLVLCFLVASFGALPFGCSRSSKPAPASATQGHSPAVSSQIQTMNMSLAKAPYALTAADVQTLQNQGLLAPGDQTALSNFVNSGN